MTKSIYALPLATFILGNIVLGIPSQAEAQTDALIGVDFDVDTGASPTNWNRFLITDTAISLIDETGAATGATFRITNPSLTPSPPPDFGSFPQTASFPTNQIPTYSNPLTNVGGYFEFDSITNLGFEGLEPNTPYQIWVFSYNELEFTNIVTIEDQITDPNVITSQNALFNYTVSGENQLYVNNQLGSDTRSLQSFITSDFILTTLDDGSLGINLQSTDFWGLAAVAIQEVQTVPEPSMLLGLGTIVGAMGLSRRKTHKN